MLDGTYRDNCEREELKTFATFVDKVYLPFARENHADSDNDEFRTAVLKEFFAGKRFDEITVLMVVRYINERLDSETVRTQVLEDGTVVNRKRSPTTVNKEVTLLSSIFNMAISDKVATFNPSSDIPRSVRAKIPARRKRNRRLSLGEQKALFEIGFVGRREYMRPISESALCTGMRKGELFRLKPEDINFSLVVIPRLVHGEMWAIPPGWLLIETSKNGKPCVIPMSQRVRRILQRLCEDITVGKYVFRSIKTGERINDIKKGYARACDEAGIVNLTFHDLRHTWSSRAAEMGVLEHVRRDILGHSSKSMTGDYTHASPEEMERAMELVASYEARDFSNLGRISANEKTASDAQSALAV